MGSRRGLVIVLLALLSAMAVLFFALQDDRAPVPGSAGRWVEDGDIRFRVDVVVCGERFVGEETDPYCLVSLQVTNRSGSRRELSPEWQVLHFTDGGTFQTSNRSPEFLRYEGEFSSSRHAFARPLEPGEEFPGELMFSNLPNETGYASLELHGAGDSRGVSIDISDCDPGC